MKLIFIILIISIILFIIYNLIKKRINNSIIEKLEMDGVMMGDDSQTLGYGDSGEAAQTAIDAVAAEEAIKQAEEANALRLAAEEAEALRLAAEAAQAAIDASAADSAATFAALNDAIKAVDDATAKAEADPTNAAAQAAADAAVAQKEAADKAAAKAVVAQKEATDAAVAQKVAADKAAADAAVAQKVTTDKAAAGAAVSQNEVAKVNNIQPDIQLPYTPTYSFSPSHSMEYIKDIDLNVKFNLKLNYRDIITDEESLYLFKRKIQKDICTLLSVSPYRIIINDFSIRSIIIYFTIKKTKYDNYTPILPNDSIFAEQLYNLLKKYLDSLYIIKQLDENSPLLYVDIYTLTIDHAANNIIDINNIIPKNTNFIDQLIAKKTPFKMYTLLAKEGVYPEGYPLNPLDKNIKKLYLTVNNKSNNLDQCTFDNGLLELREEKDITINSIFRLSTVELKSILKENKPFKYIDFNNTYVDPRTNQTVVQSQFYNLQLYNSHSSITYCAEDCEEVNSFCAQEETLKQFPSNKNGYTYEKIVENKKSDIDIKGLKLTKLGLEQKDNNNNNNTNSNIIKHKLYDTHNIKNYLKIKIENEQNMIVTPYFISKNPIERIYFITNKYNIIGEPSNYKKLIQVPKYIDESNIGGTEKPYYETPVYKNNALIYEKTLITGLVDPYTDDEIKEFKDKKSMMNTETHAFKNSAYLSYSLQFYIEPIANLNINTLNKND